MKTSAWHHVIWAAATTVAVPADLPHASAADFVVESTIHQLSGPEDTTGSLKASYVTIFDGECVYDFQVDMADRLIVLDFAGNSVWRVDVREKTKEQLSLTDVERISAQLSNRAARYPGLMGFAADPQFDARRFDEPRMELQLEHHWLTYVARIEMAKQAELSGRYRAFADWSARLNSLAPGIPSAARIELNREIALRDAVPRSVRVHRRLNDKRQEWYESRHVYRLEPSSVDLVRLKQFQEWLTDAEDKAWVFAEPDRPGDAKEKLVSKR